MSHSDLAIDLHNQQLDELMTEYHAAHQNGSLKSPRCTRMAIYQNPGPNAHIQNAIKALDTIRLPLICTDHRPEYDYIRLQLLLALQKGQTR